ncbi:MAG: PKD domain-containing protein [Flavobacteriales bacterium]
MKKRIAKKVWTVLVAVCGILLLSTESFAQCTASAGADQTVCSGSSVTLGGAPSAAGGVGPYTFDWSGLSGADDAANPTITLNATTTFTLTITDANGCSASDDVTITVTPLPTANAGPDIDPCLNTPSVTLTSGGTWTGAGGSMLNGNVFTPNTVGTYTLTFTVTANGCSNSDQKSIQVRPKPTVNAGADQSICIGSCAQLAAVASSTNGPITLYTWSGGTVSNSMNASPTACPTNSTTFNVTVVDAEQCNAQDQVTVTVLPLPTVDAGPTMTLCSSSGPTPMTGHTPAGGTWSGSGITSSGVFTPSGVGSFTVTYTYTNSNGCTNTDTRTIDVVTSTAIDAGQDFTACVGGSPLSLAPITPGGTWSGSTYVTSAGVFTPTVMGPYTLTYSVNTGVCVSTDNVNVTVYGLPTVSAGLDKNICIGSSTTLNGSATGGLAPYTIVWDNTSSLSNGSSLTPTASPTISTIYNLTVTDNRGCSATDAVNVNVNALPTVEAGPDMTLCNNPVSTTLTGFSPAGGTWSGSGVTSSGVFTPSGVGTFTLTYTYTNAAACTSTDTRVITVIDATSINAGPDRTVCHNAGSIVLNPVTPGGTWSGSVLVTSTGIFNPTTVGTYTLTYSINGGVCTSVDQIIVTVYGLPSANAGADQTICAGASANLNCTASGGASPYNPTWNNGSSLSSTNAMSTVATPTVTTSYTLTITDANGCVSNDNITVNVNSTPAVDAGSDMTTCEQASPFTMTGQTPAGGTWSGSCISPTGQFTPCGASTFTVTYAYTSPQGCSASDTKQITVTLAPTINAGPDESLCNNLGVLQLGQTASSAGIWTGVGIVNSNLGTFDPMVSGPGYHTVTLTIGTGVCQISDQRVVQVKSAPNVSAGTDQSACHMAPEIPLTGGYPTGGHWEGPGVDDDDAEFDPSEVSVGTVEVMYRYLDNITTCSDTAYKNIVVNIVPTASFNIETVACENSVVVPSNTSLNSAGYLWHFGEGTELSGLAPSHIYTNEGNYDIRLIAISNANCRDTVYQSIDIKSPPTANIQASAVQGCAPLHVDYTASVTGDDVTYAWDFGNTQTSSSIAPNTQTYIEGSGITNYVAVLNVTNLCGVATAMEEITVMPRPVANFNTDILTTACSPVIVSFDNVSAGLPDQSIWNFGDGSAEETVDVPMPRIYYAANNSETYDIQLVVVNECGSDTLMQELTVMPNVVHAAMSASALTGCTPFDLHVANTGTGGISFQYEFEPSVLAMGANADYQFTEAGDYTIYQYATDGCGFDTTHVVIHVDASPEVSFVPTSSVTCEYSTVEFQATAEIGTELYWNFGDGNLAESDLVQNVYPNAGNYTVTLHAVGGNMCSTDVSQNILVNPRPTALFTNPEYLGCTPYALCPENQTTGATTYFWDFGDGNTFTEASPCFTFPNFGIAPVTRNVVLLVTNEYNCSHTYQHVFEILPQPEADFAMVSYTSCDYPVVVSPESVVTTDITAYNWMIDGSSVSTDTIGQLPFNDEGSYQLALQTTNQYGCTKTNSVEYNVYPAVVASCTYSDPSGCMDHTVHFESTCENATQTYWQFGDGVSSLANNPSYVYDDLGTFDVTLIASAGNGCADTLIMHNLVETFPLPVASFDISMREVSILFPEVEFENTTTDGSAYLWTFGDGESSTTEHPMHEYTYPGVYPVTLTVTNTYGCEGRITDEVVVTNDFQVYIPNSFTPNNDGLNDVFMPVMEGMEFVTRYEFQVFNRWGEVVWETTNPNIGWAGNPKGEDYYSESETYSYQLIIEIEQSAETKVYRGLMTMVK